MPAGRADPFRRVLATLRERLASGTYPQEAKLEAAALAHEFGVSPTPLREALSHLAGEGLLEERRGLGFFLPRLSGKEIADLFRLHEAHLRIALSAGEGVQPPLERPSSEAEAVLASERLFARCIARSGGRILVQGFGRIQSQLGRVRRLEPGLLAGLAPEFEGVAQAAAEGGLAAELRRFHARRARLASVFAERLALLAGPAEL